MAAPGHKTQDELEIIECPLINSQGDAPECKWMKAMMVTMKVKVTAVMVMIRTMTAKRCLVETYSRF